MVTPLEVLAAGVGGRQVQRKKGTDSEFRPEAFVFWVGEWWRNSCQSPFFASLEGDAGG